MSDFTEEKDTGYTLARYLGFGTLAYGGFKFATTFDRGIFGRSKEVVDISQKITNTIVPFARLKAPLQSVTPDISDLEPLHRAYIEQGTQLKFGSSLDEALSLPEGRSYVNRLMNQAPSFLEQMPSDVLSSGLSTFSKPINVIPHASQGAGRQADLLRENIQAYLESSSNFGLKRGVAQRVAENLEVVTRNLGINKVGFEQVGYSSKGRDVLTGLNIKYFPYGKGYDPVAFELPFTRGGQIESRYGVSSISRKVLPSSYLEEIRTGTSIKNMLLPSEAALSYEEVVSRQFATLSGELRGQTSGEVRRAFRGLKENVQRTLVTLGEQYNPGSNIFNASLFQKMKSSQMLAMDVDTLEPYIKKYGPESLASIDEKLLAQRGTELFAGAVSPQTLVKGGVANLGEFDPRSFRATGLGSRREEQLFRNFVPEMGSQSEYLKPGVFTPASRRAYANVAEGGVGGAAIQYGRIATVSEEALKYTLGPERANLAIKADQLLVSKSFSQTEMFQTGSYKNILFKNKNGRMAIASSLANILSKAKTIDSTMLKDHSMKLADALSKGTTVELLSGLQKIGSAEALTSRSAIKGLLSLAPEQQLGMNISGNEVLTKGYLGDYAKEMITQIKLSEGGDVADVLTNRSFRTGPGTKIYAGGFKSQITNVLSDRYLTAIGSHSALTERVLQKMRDYGLPEEEISKRLSNRDTISKLVSGKYGASVGGLVASERGGILKGFGLAGSIQGLQVEAFSNVTSEKVAPSMVEALLQEVGLRHRSKKLINQKKVLGILERGGIVLERGELVSHASDMAAAWTGGELKEVFGVKKTLHPAVAGILASHQAGIITSKDARLMIGTLTSNTKKGQSLLRRTLGNDWSAEKDLAKIVAESKKRISASMRTKPLTFAIGFGGPASLEGAGNLGSISARLMSHLFSKGQFTFAAELLSRQKNSNVRLARDLSLITSSVFGDTPKGLKTFAMGSPEYNDFVRALRSTNMVERQSLLKSVGVEAGETALLDFSKKPIAANIEGAAREIKQLAVPTELSNLLGQQVIRGEEGVTNIQRGIGQRLSNVIGSVESGRGGQVAVDDLLSFTKQHHQILPRMLGGKVEQSLYNLATHAGPLEASREAINQFVKEHGTGSISSLVNAEMLSKRNASVLEAHGIQSIQDIFDYSTVGFKSSAFKKMGLGGDIVAPVLFARLPGTSPQRISTELAVNLDALAGVFSQKNIMKTGISKARASKIATIASRGKNLEADAVAVFLEEQAIKKLDLDGDKAVAFSLLDGKSREEAAWMLKGGKAARKNFPLNEFTSAQTSSAGNFSKLAQIVDDRLDDIYTKGMKIENKAARLSYLQGAEEYRAGLHTLMYQPLLKAEKPTAILDALTKGTPEYAAHVKSQMASMVLEKDIIGKASVSMTRARRAWQSYHGSGATDAGKFKTYMDKFSPVSILSELIEEKIVNAKNISEQNVFASLDVADEILNMMNAVPETRDAQLLHSKNLASRVYSLMGTNQETAPMVAEGLDQMVESIGYFQRVHTDEDMLIRQMRSQHGMAVEGVANALLSGNAGLESDVIKAMGITEEGLLKGISRKASGTAKASKLVMEEFRRTFSKTWPIFGAGLAAAAAIGLVFGKPGDLTHLDDETMRAMQQHPESGNVMDSYPSPVRLTKGLEDHPRFTVNTSGPVNTNAIIASLRELSGGPPVATVQDYRPEMHGDYIFQKIEDGY